MNKSKVIQYEFLNDTSKQLWQDQIQYAYEDTSNNEEAVLIKNFADLLENTKFDQLKNPKIQFQPNFQKVITENTTKLKSEISDLYLINQNICSLTIEKSVSQNFPRKTVDREKNGFKIAEIRVSRSVINESDSTDAVIAIRDFNSALKLKTLVFLKDFRNNFEKFKKKKRNNPSKKRASKFHKKSNK